jgi:hypothetical protein
MSADTLRIVAAGVAMALLVGVPAFLYVSLTSTHFRVASSSYTGHGPTDPDYSRTRGCIGFRYTPESRDGYHTQCVGAPFGRWRCYATLPDDQGSWEVSCD